MTARPQACWLAPRPGDSARTRAARHGQRMSAWPGHHRDRGWPRPSAVDPAV